MLKKLYTFSDKNYEPVKKKFFETLKDDFDVRWTEMPNDVGPGNFRNDFIIRAIEENMGDDIVYSDIDTLFLAPVKPVLEQTLQGVKIATAFDDWLIHHQMFLIAIKCDKTTLTMFKEIKRLEDSIRPIVSYRNLLSKGYVKWNKLPTELIYHHCAWRGWPHPAKPLCYHYGDGRGASKTLQIMSKFEASI